MTAREVHDGGVYSVAAAGGSFKVVKVLAHQPERNTIYVRLFDAQFERRPEVQRLEGNTLDETLGIGIGALPITPKVFAFWQPELLSIQTITGAEREDLSLCFGVAQPWDDLMDP